jgi:hypothetical protein
VDHVRAHRPESGDPLINLPDAWYGSSNVPSIRKSLAVGFDNFTPAFGKGKNNCYHKGTNFKIAVKLREDKPAAWQTWLQILTVKQW